MKKIIFISDYFIDEISGGAEFCNDALITEFLQKKYHILKIKSQLVDLKFLLQNKENYFIIANFFLLSEENKDFIKNNLNYSILEHDHKYLKSNNPAIYNDFLAPENIIQNLNFYKQAKFVLCQSTLHSEIIFKNTLLNNIVNLKGNIWKQEQYDVLEKFCNNSQKNIKYAIIKTNNKNKGMINSVNYCYEKKINFDYLYETEFPKFMEQLSKVENLIFMPNWIETFSRLSIEAKILGCKLITNKFLGSASDGYLKYSNIELLNIIKNRQNEIFKIFEDIIDGKSVETFNIKMPKIDIISTFLNGEKYLDNYLNFVSQQTIFNEIDLYLLDAGSTGREKEIIEKFTKKYSNIHYIRKEEKMNIPESFNYILNNSNNELVSFLCIDDCPAPYHCEILRKHLIFSNDIDLTYGDCVESNMKIEKFNIKNNFSFYEHSLNGFSRENMIKCLPGPMPMFKRKMLEKNGFFNNSMNYANDWELWLRCVRGGSKFKKVEKIVGIYFKNPDGNSTTQDESRKLDRQREEKRVFYEYKDVFGETNFNLYKSYFDSFKIN
jgi:hypothetical protein